jgi:hypothetical protein
MADDAKKRGSPVYSQFDLAVNDGLGTDWEINGEAADELVADYLLDQMSMLSWGNTQCPYCGTQFRLSTYRELADTDNEESDLDRVYELKVCRHCAFWEFRGSEGVSKCMDPSTTVLATAIAKKFEDKLPAGCSEELAQHLRRHPDVWHRIDPRRLEQLVTDIFRANYDNCEVEHVGRPGDGGVDVVFVDSEKSKWLIQVKRRSSHGRPEGPEALRNLLGTCVVKGESKAIVVTTADYYSNQAQRECKEANDRGQHTIKLIDKTILDRMLGPMLPKHPWTEFFRQAPLKEIDDRVRSYFAKEDQLDLFKR